MNKDDLIYLGKIVIGATVFAVVYNITYEAVEAIKREIWYKRSEKKNKN